MKRSFFLFIMFLIFLESLSRRQLTVVGFLMVRFTKSFLDQTGSSKTESECYLFCDKLLIN